MWIKGLGMWSTTVVLVNSDHSLLRIRFVCSRRTCRPVIKAEKASLHRDELHKDRMKELSRFSVLFAEFDPATLMKTLSDSACFQCVLPLKIPDIHHKHSCYIIAWLLLLPVVCACDDATVHETSAAVMSPDVLCFCSSTFPALYWAWLCVVGVKADRPDRCVIIHVRMNQSVCIELQQSWVKCSSPVVEFEPPEQHLCCENTEHIL